VVKLTEDQIKYLNEIASLGFFYEESIRKMPPELADLYRPYYGRKAMRSITRNLVKSFSSISLAIAKGYTPEERKQYLASKGNKK